MYLNSNDFKRFLITLRLNFSRNGYLCDMKLIELNLQRIIDICRKHRVKSLAVFGSILTDRFNDSSDVDMLIDFEDYDRDNPHGFDYVTNFFNLQDSLETLLKRKVDLVVESSLRNKYFINNINRTKQAIYG